MSDIYRPLNITYKTISTLSYLGLDNSSLVINTTDAVRSHFQLDIDNLSGINPSVETFLQADVSSIQFSKCVNSYSVNKIFIVLDIDENFNSEEQAIYECDINNFAVNNISLLSSGKFSTKELFTVSSSENIDDFDTRSIFRTMSFSVACPISSIVLLDSGSGYKLNSNFSLANTQHRNIIQDHTSIDDASIDVNLSLQEDTVIISGGVDYNVGDIFTVVNSDGSNGEIKVSSVDVNGSIINTELTNAGLGFVQTPTVSYSGSGNSAIVNIYDRYSVGSVELVDQGNGYVSVPLYILATDQSQVSYNPTEKASVRVSTENILSEDSLIINDKFKLHSVSFDSYGNNYNPNQTKIILQGIVDESLDVTDFITVTNPINVDIVESLDNRPSFSRSRQVNLDDVL